MTDNPKLHDGVKLVKGDIFCPEGQWFFTLDDRPLPLVWGKTEGWKVYYATNPADSHFQTKEVALKKWTEAHKCEFVPEEIPEELREELRKKLRS